MEKKGILLLILILAFSLHLSAAQETHGSSSLDLAGKILNFIVLFGGLAFLLRKPLIRFLQERARMLEREMEESAKDRKEAEQKLAGARLRLESLGKEVEAVRAESEKAGQALRESVLGEAEREAERLRAFTRQEIERMGKAALREIRAYAAEMAAERARERIGGGMTAELHTAIIDRSIEKLERVHEE